MHIPTKSGALYFLRIVQSAIAAGFLILICWCGVHRAWWDNINGSLAVAVLAAIFTFILSAFSIVSHHRSSDPFSGSTARFIIRIGVEIVVILVYIAAAGLMLRPKEGCPQADNYPGKCIALDGNEAKVVASYDDQPLTEWDVAIVFSFVEIVSYFMSLALVFMEGRSSKMTSTSYA